MEEGAGTVGRRCPVNGSICYLAWVCDTGMLRWQNADFSGSSFNGTFSFAPPSAVIVHSPVLSRPYNGKPLLL